MAGIWAFDQKADQAVVAGPLAANNQTLAWGGNNIAGDLLVCVVSWTGAGITLSSIVDSISPTPNTYTLLTTINYGTNQHVALGYVLSAIAGTTPTVTATFSTTGATNVQLSLVEETTPFPSSVANSLDVQTSGTGSSNSMLSGLTSQNAAANELAIGYGATGVAETLTAGSGYTLRTTSASRGNAIEDDFIQGLSATGLEAIIAIGASVAWGCGVVVFKPGSIAAVDADITGFGNIDAPNRFGAVGNEIAIGNYIPGSLLGGGQTITF